MNEEQRLKIKQSQIETKIKRKSQILKVYELKLNVHHISKQDVQKFDRLFKEAKWITNDMIASNDIFHYNYKDHRQVKRFNKNSDEIVEQILMCANIHQSLCDQQKHNITNLSKAKKKGLKIGKLKFKSEVNCIPMKNRLFRIINSKTVMIPGFKKLSIYGLEQFINQDFELANCNIIKKASGIYLKITVFFNDKKCRIKTNKEVGLDFGIKDNIITSDGVKYNYSKREDEYLKFLQKQLHRKQKNSKRYWNLRNQIQKQYEYISNCKNDYANKLVAELLKEYDWIYFQDENLRNWKKFNKGFAREIQGSILGRVKAKLVALEGKKTTKISRWVPTTKACTNCGEIHNELTLADRIFKCDCGIEEDRDIHAAKNVKIFGSRQRTGCLGQASAEDYINTLALTALQIDVGANIPCEAKTKNNYL
jgi:transposase